MANLRLKLGNLVPGGQTIATTILESGQVKKVFAWGGLPDEEVEVRVIKKRAGIIEAVVERVLTKSQYRVEPEDKNSYLSTSPWQIMDYDYELEQKASLVQQVFRQHQLEISRPEIVTDRQDYHYRNKMEFTWWWDKEAEKIDLAHYRRGAKGKIAVVGSSLARPEINAAALAIRDLLNDYQIQARQLKTLLLRASRQGQVVAQLYVVDLDLMKLTDADFQKLNIRGLDIIYSEPKSPASVITKQLQSFGEGFLTDRVFNKDFSYPAESFFQINLPVYELALAEIERSLTTDQPIVDLYSGVGTIGLSVANNRPLTLVEIDQRAVDEMQSNIARLGLKNSLAILSPAESATDYVTSDCQLIVDPPRAGLHAKVVNQILAVRPKRVIYLSCNPATQARDVALLVNDYKITSVKVFNFFPRTPHIESLVILDSI